MVRAPFIMNVFARCGLGTHQCIPWYAHMNVLFLATTSTGERIISLNNYNAVDTISLIPFCFNFTFRETCIMDIKRIMVGGPTLMMFFILCGMYIHNTMQNTRNVFVIKAIYKMVYIPVCRQYPPAIEPTILNFTVGWTFSYTVMITKGLLWT